MPAARAAERRESVAKLGEEPACIVFVLKARDVVVGVAHEDHVLWHPRPGTQALALAQSQTLRIARMTTRMERIEATGGAFDAHVALPASGSGPGCTRAM